MRGSWLTSLRFRAAALFASALLSAAACQPAELRFDKLDACADVAALRSMLLEPRPATCGSATGPIGRALVEAAGPMPNGLCFLRSAPVASLASFDCVRQGGVKGAISCYRPASLPAIEEYKRDFVERYAAPVDQYLQRAHRCPVSNATFGIAGTSLLPALFAAVSSHEVGFIVNLGRATPSDSAAVHGFARSAPTLAARGVEAIEYVSVYFGPDVPDSALLGDPVGPWRVSIDDGKAFIRDFESMLRGKGVAAHVKMIGIDIHRDVTALPYSGGSVTRGLADRIVSDLEDEGFEAASARVMRQLGIAGDDPTTFLRNSLSYGRRGELANMGSHPSAVIMMKADGMPCTTQGGAFGVDVIRFDGVEGVKLDHGSVSVIVFGVGACGRSSGAPAEYVNNLVSDARQAVMGALQP